MDTYRTLIIFLEFPATLVKWTLTIHRSVTQELLYAVGSWFASSKTP
ncbi:MAG TPA: hypothetical protein IGS17_02155 [Oscillatoriales cyanobacterium M59_W2019_021]|nr:hypothetical protein [Oscillatoriales cyanobacterium M4454_W2019_049]HIK49718.1 hypothetical protein [Oscillatoriales cyanobacterium M59_W2019_021]